ncbi:hypothetical protein ACWDTT_26080 [Streptosporangium sandarakinum]
MAAAVLLVLGLAAAWSVLIPGVGAWENTVVAMIGSLRLTGPVSAAFAAWVAVRRRRESGRWLPTTWRAVRTPLAVAAVPTVAFAATALVLAVRTILGEQSGRLPPSGLLMGMAGLALYVAIGWVTGWLLPWTITPVIAGLGCYGLFAWLARSGTWADRLAPATREPYDPFQGLSTAAFADQTFWLLGISAVLLLGWAAVVTRQSLALAGALLAVLAAAAGMARLLNEPRTVTAQRVVYSCEEWPIMVCVHPGMRDGLPELGSAFVRIASRLAGTPGEFSRLEQRPRREDAPLPPGSVPIHVDDLSSGFADQAAAEFVESLAPRCAGTTAQGYRDIVVAWLAGRPLPGGPLAEHQYAAAWFAGLTDTQRRDWLRTHYDRFAGCGLQSGDFGGQVPQVAQPAAPVPGGYPASAGPAPQASALYGTPGGAPTAAGAPPLPRTAPATSARRPTPAMPDR